MPRDLHDRTSPKGRQTVGRRAMLECSAAGGLALAAALFGGAEASEAAAFQTSPPPSTPAGRMRRVVTAHNPEGKSVIAGDEVVDVARLWNTGPEKILGDAPAGEPRQVSRATGETRCFVATIQPSKDPKPNLTNRIGFHRTPGVAYCFMLTGEVVFMVDTQEVRVRAGDLVVERNTMHSWRNEGTTPMTMFIVTVNAS